ncbi:MAG TPA: primary-amine oxidase [Bryobacteraceae bacterium]|jgi:primary-amine oxidase|nr:primary-amine oxidase [Bryobacteraceae bacterium]
MRRAFRGPSITALLALLVRAAASHPLTPLSAAEIRAAAKIFRDSGRIPAISRFSLITLAEPPKDQVLRGAAIPRRAFAVIYDVQMNHTWEAVADLSANRLESFQSIPGAQPAVTVRDSEAADRIVRADPRWQQAMRERGIDDPDHVVIVAWSAGYFALPNTGQDRVVRALSYYGGADSNFDAHPVEGVVAHVDVTSRKILDFLDTDRKAPVSRERFNLDAASNQPLRAAPAPLTIVQPRPGFQIEDGEVRWQKWRFRYALHPREGLVLYQVGYEDGGRVRSILYRASLSEMVVPYGDPSGAWFFRNSFDAGELGLGEDASTLRPGIDCPTNCLVFDAVMAQPSGIPRTLPGAVALYERDAGIAWKHGDDARRARDLVLAFSAEVGNYDYGFDWIFHQDGALEMRVALTGIMAVKGVADGAHEPYSHLVASNIAAPHHQHFFTFRLDMDVDGAANRVMEWNSTPAPAGAHNPYGGAFTMTETPLRTEHEAERHLNLATSRRWVIESSSAKNALGHPTAFALLPGENAEPFAAADSWVRKRAGFLNAHVWVTPYRLTEMYAGGDYPNQSHGGDGLTKWTAANRSIDNQDVVLWYTMGVTHNPRPEDWPVMPVHAAGFRLEPWGFFAKNPAMDLPQ